MRAKIIIGLLITLVAMSMFATSTRTSAAPNNRPLLSYTPEPNIPIDMYELHGNGFTTGIECTPGSTKFGCTAFCDNSEDEYKQWCNPKEPGEPYPYGSSTIVVPVQTYYLLDVLAGEMSPSPEWMPIPVALRAQAIAARSYVWWQYEFNKPVNNSNAFQVYVPYRFDKLNPTAAPMEPEILTPCHPYRFRNEPQEMECDAIAPQYYLSSWNDDLPALAMFHEDWTKKTVTYPDQEKHPYLVGVEEPISTACDSSDDDSFGWGMSQWGAARWARGDQCALGRYDPDPWSVKWTHPEQILFHYFTRVQLRDANNDKKIVSPEWRWNPLMFQWKAAEQNNQPPVLRPGGSYPVVIQIQNTGLYAWRCLGLTESPIPGSRYYLRYYWSLAGSAEDRWRLGKGKVSVCGTQPGDPSPEKVITIDDVPTTAGNYMLHFDINDTATNSWFRLSGWPTYDVEVQVVPPTIPSPTPTSCGFDGC